MTDTIRTDARNASLKDLAEILEAQHARKLDVVAPATTVRSEGGLLVVEGIEGHISEDGVTPVDGVYRPTAVFDEGVSDKLGIPLAYVRRLREQRPDLYDANVNGWLHGYGQDRGLGGVLADPPSRAEPDRRSFLLRLFRGDDGSEGIARAMLSDSYKVVDNLDVLLAALDGVRNAGVEVDIDGCDLTERSMRVRISAPQVQALAPTLLRNYRSPFTGESGADNPVVFAGFVLGNSETGGGAFTLTPRVTIKVCANGQTFSGDALRNVHLGGKMEEGVIRWSDATRSKNLELVTSQTVDAVSTFLDVGYVERKIGEMEEAAGIALANPSQTVETVTKRLKFTQDQADGILDHFIRAGDVTSSGVMHAVTSYAQVVDDPDAAAELEGSAVEALSLAASLA